MLYVNLYWKVNYPFIKFFCQSIIKSAKYSLTVWLKNVTLNIENIYRLSAIFSQNGGLVMRNKNTLLTPNELDILLVLWNEGRSLSRPEILEKMPKIDWNPNSIHLILNNMIKKGVLEVDGMTRCGRVYGRTYAPVMSQVEYAASEAGRITANLPKKNRILGIVSALFDQQGIDTETIKEVEQLLIDKEKELSITK